MKLTELELKRSGFAYFLGKMVTVQTNRTPISYGTDKDSLLLHFRSYSGICEGFDEFGVWLIHAETNAKSFYFFKDIQGFIEHPALPESHPVVKDAVEKMKQHEVVKKGKELSESLGELSVEDFSRLIERL